MKFAKALLVLFLLNGALLTAPTFASTEAEITRANQLFASGIIDATNGRRRPPLGALISFILRDDLKKPGVPEKTGRYAVLQRLTAFRFAFSFVDDSGNTIGGDKVSEVFSKIVKTLDEVIADVNAHRNPDPHESRVIVEVLLAHLFHSFEWQKNKTWGTIPTDSKNYDFDASRFFIQALDATQLSDEPSFLKSVLPSVYLEEK